MLPKNEGIMVVFANQSPITESNIVKLEQMPAPVLTEAQLKLRAISPMYEIESIVNKNAQITYWQVTYKKPSEDPPCEHPAGYDIK